MSRRYRAAAYNVDTATAEWQSPLCKSEALADAVDDAQTFLDNTDALADTDHLRFVVVSVHTAPIREALAAASEQP